jgi:hypothetical protein
VKPGRVQPTDAEIEAIVADAIAREAALAGSEAQPPSSAIVWWRAQMRARQEASRLAEKPITIVHALSIAAGIGLMLSVAGYVAAGMKGSWGWLASVAESFTGTTGGALPSLSLTSPWVAVTVSAMLVTVLVASITAYVIYSD